MTSISIVTISMYSSLICLSLFPAIFCAQTHFCFLTTEEGESKGFCTFANVFPNPNEDYDFASGMVGQVEKVEFNSSKVTLFTAKLCDSFADVWDLRIWRMKIEIIAQGALNGCKRLKILNLYQNQLQLVDKTLLMNNPELTLVVFTENLIEFIDPQAFASNTKLQKVYLDSNCLKSFETLTSLPALTFLVLGSNYILHLDIEKLLLRMTGLKKIYIGDNYFECENLEKILELSKGKVELVKAEFPRERKIEPSKRDGIECYNKTQLSEIRLELLIKIDYNLTAVKVRQIEDHLNFSRFMHTLETLQKTNNSFGSLDKWNLVILIVLCVVFFLVIAIPVLIFVIHQKLRVQIDNCEKILKENGEPEYCEVR